MPDDAIRSVQQAFVEFERDVVRVTKAENDTAKAVRPQIRATLAHELNDHLGTFLSGSYGRRVQAVNLKDVDIICVLDDPDDEYADSADRALGALEVAAAASDLVRYAEKRVRSVRLTLHDHESA